MKGLGQFFGQASPRRALVEGWLVCAFLLIPLRSVVLPAPPLPRSLYLILLPLLCALVVGLRMKFFWEGENRGTQLKADERGFVFKISSFIRVYSRTYSLKIILVEICLAAVLALGILGLVLGFVAILGQLEAIRRSSAGNGGTIFFLLLAAPEYLGARAAVWLVQRWNRLRRQRYAWALANAILMVVGMLGLLALTGFLLWLAAKLGTDIWGIPPESTFAKVVFWLSMLILVGAVLLAAGLVLFLPPAILFSFWVARRMTARVETLALATRALQGGDLSRRVELQGEDEIAQLQADFNAMAADLEGSVQALQTEKDKVWRLMEARRELVAEVSHELRNPVAIILGFSEMLRRCWQERSPEDLAKDLDSIQDEARRMQTILNDLLAAAQLEAGRLQVKLAPVEITALARQLVERFSRLAWNSKRVQVSLAAPDAPLVALADALRLEQVLVNLLQNGLRHTSPGGLVAVEIGVDGERVWIEVEDTGEGISPGDLPHIWEKYYQASSAAEGVESRREFGMGLGLALVKELTEAMGGNVSVESQVGQGSVFQVYLPVCI